MALTPEQLKVIRELKAAPSWKRAGKKAKKALLEAGRVESDFSTPNQANSDRDSEGALQQRPSQGWGPTSETNTQDAEQFLRRAIPLERKYKTSGELAQAVQRSAYPDRYNQHTREAERLVGGSGGGGSTRSRGLGQSRGSAATPGKLDRGLGVTVTPATTSIDYDAALTDALLAGSTRRKPSTGGILKAMMAGVATGAYTTRTPQVVDPGRPASYTPGKPATTAASGGDGGSAKAKAPKAHGGYLGTRGAILDLGKLAEGLKVTSAKRNNTNPASGSRSDHDHGNKDAYAQDFSNGSSPTPEMDAFAVKVTRALGIKGYKRGTGIAKTVTLNGIRYQVIYRSNVGGNHFNHVHVGAKRVG